MTARIGFDATAYVPRVGNLDDYMPTQPVMRQYVPRPWVTSLVRKAKVAVMVGVWLYLVVLGGAIGGLLLKELT